MTSISIRLLALSSLLTLLSACGSSSGSSSAGTRIQLSATPDPVNMAAQPAGSKTFTSDLGAQITLDKAYLVLTSATIETSCGASFIASTNSLLDFFISAAVAHTTTTPTSTGEPYAIDLTQTDLQPESIGSLSPPTGDYCGVSFDILAADADTLNLPAGVGEPDIVGKSVYIEGSYSVPGGGSGLIHISTGVTLVNRDLLLSTPMDISRANLNGQINIGIRYDSWFDALDVETMETETALQTNPNDPNVNQLLQNITASIHQI